MTGRDENRQKVRDSTSMSICLSVPAGPPYRGRIHRCCDEREQRAAFLTKIEDSLGLPFETMVLDVAVIVERIDLTEADEIVAICRRGTTHQTVPILELTLPTPRPSGAEWIEAYRRWSGGK